MRFRFLLFLVLAGCASKQFIDGDQAPEGIRKKFTTRTFSDCHKNGGVWRPMTEIGVFHEGGYCMTKTSDAGRVCSSSGDCQSYCELSMDDQDAKPRCASTIPPRWDRCIPGYFEHGKVLGRGECFGEDSEVQ